jgi:hypothetical protein
MSVENLFFSPTHQVNQISFGCIHEAKKKFQRFFVYKRFASKFKQMFIKRHLEEFKLYTEYMSLYQRLYEYQISLFVFNMIFCHLKMYCIHNYLCLLLGNKFSKLDELFCNYRDFICFSHKSYFVLLGSVHVYQQFKFHHVLTLSL